MKLILSIILLTLSMAGKADWTLCNQASALNFVSTVNEEITEVHSFTNMEGHISNSGNATLKVDLASIETNNPTRNERVRKIIFNIENFQELTISIQLDPTELNTLPMGDSVVEQVTTTINLHGIRKRINVSLQITRLQTGCLLITSLNPVMIPLADFKLLDKLEQLRQVAHLDSIGKTIPITFRLFYLKNPGSK